MSLFDPVFGGRRARYDSLLDLLAEALSRGDHARAVAVGEEALKLGEGIFGRRSHALSLPLYGLASAHLARGEHAAAEVLLRRALDDLDEPTSAAEGAPRARLLEMLASIVLRGGAQLDSTETLLRRWVDACRVAEPAEPEALAGALNQLGLFLGRRDKRDEARTAFDEALRLRRREAPRHRAVAEVLYNAATFRPAARPLDEVRADLEEALGLVTGEDPDERALRASVLHNLGVVLEELGDAEAAQARLSEALEVGEALRGAGDPTLRPTLVRLAQLHHRQGRILFALPLYERALSIAKVELGAEHAIVRAIEAWKRELTEGA